MSREDGKWVADTTLGPRMRKSVEKVLGKLKSEGASFYTAHKGFKGDPVDPDDLRFYTTRIFIGGRRDDEELDPGVEKHLADCLAAEEAIKERFDYLLTAKNYKAVIEEYLSEAKRLGELRPVVDDRPTPTEKAERDALIAERNAKDDAERQVREAMTDRVNALAPAGSTSVIIAQLKEDTSDIMSDYSSNKTVRSVVIGFSHKTREDFSELHRAAASFPDTAHLGDGRALRKWCEAEERGHSTNYICERDGEHRDNYSMGTGNYLSDHGWDGGGSGWRVSRYSLPLSHWPTVTEIAPGLEEAA